MARLYDPLYPLYVNYRVSQPIWELHEIYIWQILFTRLGKTRVFLSLQIRHEMNLRKSTALVFLVIVFLISFLILQLLKWRESQRISANNRTQTNSMDHERANNANDVNDCSSNGRQPINVDQKEKEKLKPKEGNHSKQTSERANT